MQNKKINIGIIGGAGYTGGELLRILVNHPNSNIEWINSRSNAGKNIAVVHEDLAGTNLAFSSETNFSYIDVLFLCLGHGESTKYLSDNLVPEHVRVIDLANDFRLNKDAVFGNRSFVYGLPELSKKEISAAKNIANPGCFATCIQLGLLPLAQAGLLTHVYTTGITGSTGAGQSFASTSHFSWRANNIQAYKTLTHQHIPEITQSINGISAKEDFQLHFVPWRGDFTRGIFASSQLECSLSLDDLYEKFNNFYKGHPFVFVSKTPISLKQVVNTNKAVIHLEKSGDALVVHSAIDNLLKGASGQAVQNMNLMFQLEETTGLLLKATAF